MVFESSLTISVPKAIRCDENGFDFFSRLAGDTITIANKNIIFDFGNCNWFDGNLCAVLGNILDGLKQRNNTLHFKGITENILNVFVRNKFYKNFISNTTPLLDSRTIPYERFKLFDEQLAKDIIKRELFDKPGMPKMSDDAQKAILLNIFEVCVNAITHGECEYVYCCGQFFPDQSSPEVSISFVDLGRTIKANVNEYLKANMTGNKTILWALGEGNTTKRGNEPGGLGLKLLQNLINYNKGSLQIVSADGFIELSNSKFKERHMTDYFPGTIVTIKLLLNDSNFYVISKEVDTDNIF